MALVRQSSTTTTDVAPHSLGLYNDPPVLALPHELSPPRLAPYTTPASASLEVHLLLPPGRLAAAVAAAASAAVSAPPAAPTPTTGTQAIGASGASPPLAPLLIVVDIHVAQYGSSSSGHATATPALPVSAAAAPTGAGPPAGLQVGTGAAGLLHTYQQLVLEPSTVEVPAGRVSVHVPQLLLAPVAAASTAPASGAEAMMQQLGVGPAAVVAAAQEAGQEDAGRPRQASTGGTHELEQVGPEECSGSRPVARRCCGMRLYLFSPVHDPGHAAGPGSATPAAASTGAAAAAAGRGVARPRQVTSGTLPPPSPTGSASDMCLQCLGWVEVLVVAPEAAAELRQQWQQMVWEVRRQADGAAPMDADDTGAAGMATAAGAAAAAVAAGAAVSPRAGPPRYEPCASAAYQFHMRPLVRDLGLLLLGPGPGPGPGQRGAAAAHGTQAAVGTELEALRDHLLGWFQATGMEACVELVHGAGPWGEAAGASQMAATPAQPAAVVEGQAGSLPHQATPAAPAEGEAAGPGASRVPGDAGADAGDGGAGSPDLSDVQELMHHLAVLSGGGRRGHPPSVPAAAAAAAAPVTSTAHHAPQHLLQPAAAFHTGGASDGVGSASDPAGGPQPQVASPSALELTLQLLSLSHPGPPLQPPPPSVPTHPAELHAPAATSSPQPRPGGRRHGNRSGPAAVATSPPQRAASPPAQPGVTHRPWRASSLGSSALAAVLVPLLGFPEPTQEAAYRRWRVAMAVRNGRDGVWGLPLPLAAGCVIGAVGVVATTLRLRAAGITERPAVKALAGMLWLLAPMAGQAARMWVLREMGTEAAEAGGRVAQEASTGEWKEEKSMKTAEEGGEVGSAGTSVGAGSSMVREGVRGGGRERKAAAESPQDVGEGTEVSSSLVLYDTFAAASTGLLASLLGLLTYTCSRPCLDVRQDDPGFTFGIFMGRAVFPPLAVPLLLHQQLLVCVGMWTVDLVHVWVLWSGEAPAWVLLLGPVLVACVNMAVCGVLDVRSRREFVRARAGQQGRKEGK